MEASLRLLKLKRKLPRPSAQVHGFGYIPNRTPPGNSLSRSGSSTLALTVSRRRGVLIQLWAYDTEADRRLWEELTAVPARRNSIRFITTYAGFENESSFT